MGGFRYTPGIVVELLKVAFDPGRTWGYKVTDAADPDPGMPKSPSDPAVCGTLWAMTADCQRALRAVRSKRVLEHVYCRYVEGFETAEIARAEGVTPQAVNYSLYVGVRDMCEFLNGEPWVDAKKSRTPVEGGGTE